MKVYTLEVNSFVERKKIFVVLADSADEAKGFVKKWYEEKNIKDLFVGIIGTSEAKSGVIFICNWEL